MEVGLTFGSLGDIIAVCQLAYRLGHALGVGARGAGSSVEEYRDLRKDLEEFVEILIQVSYLVVPSPLITTSCSNVGLAVPTGRHYL